MKKILLILSILLLAGLCYPINPTSVFSGKDYKNSLNSLTVYDYVKNKKIYNLNGSVSVLPASVLKLITTATALELLGPDYKFQTIIGYKGKVSNGILDGDLVVSAGGDPTLGSRHFNDGKELFLIEICKAVKSFGINQIRGQVVVDVSIFDNEPVSPFWLWEDIGNYYAPVITGMSVFDNCYTLTLKSGKPGTRPEITGVDMPEIDLTFDNYLIAANNNKDSAYIYGEPLNRNRVLRGSIPAGRESFSIRGDIPDPTGLFLNLLTGKLKENNIIVREGIVTHNKVEGVKIIKTLLSKPLGEIVKIANKKSDNLFAEYLLRHIALTKAKGNASAKVGVAVLKSFWHSKGLDTYSLQMVDGSGLSPVNRVSSEFLSQLLVYMARQSKYFKTFEQSLPFAGLEGSVSGFLSESELKGKLRLKSGTMQGVTCYAGYYYEKGLKYVVVLMSNHLYLPRNKVRNDFQYFLQTL